MTALSINNQASQLEETSLKEYNFQGRCDVQISQVGTKAQGSLGSNILERGCPSLWLGRRAEALQNEVQCLSVYRILKTWTSFSLEILTLRL